MNRPQHSEQLRNFTKLLGERVTQGHTAQSDAHALLAEVFLMIRQGALDQAAALADRMTKRWGMPGRPWR